MVKKQAKRVSWGVRTKRGALGPWAYLTKREAFENSLPSYGDTVVRVEMREVRSERK